MDEGDLMYLKNISDDNLSQFQIEDTLKEIKIKDEPRLNDVKILNMSNNMI